MYALASYLNADASVSGVIVGGVIVIAVVAGVIVWLVLKGSASNAALSRAQWGAGSFDGAGSCSSAIRIH
jgi:hypothetical protein